ncbi:hypothetical protein Lesp01_49890 [Lentzea sp. NBRC 102530]|nr:hypothetical protein Lesp01_49890 [Lentzea sp. NBRC 102530]
MRRKGRRGNAGLRRGATAPIDYGPDGMSRWRPCPVCWKVGWIEEHFAKQALTLLREEYASRARQTGLDHRTVKRVFQCDPTGHGLWHTTSQEEFRFTALVLPPPPEPVTPNLPEYWESVRLLIIGRIKTSSPGYLPRLAVIASHFGTHQANRQVKEMIQQLVASGFVELRDDIPGCGKVYATRFAGVTTGGGSCSPRSSD